MNADDLKQRTKEFALAAITLVQAFEPSDFNRVAGRQLLRSATSVGANYRSACRAKSKADMRNKLKIVEEELDESLYWMERQSSIVNRKSIANITTRNISWLQKN